MSEVQNKPYQIWLPLLLSICTVIGLIGGTQLTGHQRPDQTPLLQTNGKADHGRELNEIVRFIEEKYVDKVHSQALISSAIHALLEDLDPHSGYLSPEDVQELNEKMEGQFEGIGIEFQRVLDTAIILHVVPGGPADKAGLKMFDRIVKANDSLMTSPDLTESDMVDFLRGSKDSDVTLEIYRPSSREMKTLEIDRDVIPIHSIEAAYRIQDKVGYIRVGNFNARTYKEFMDQVEKLSEKEGVEDLVIDLRQNPGGYLKEAVNILSQLFKEKGKLLVYTEGQNAPRTEYKSTGKPFYPVNNIVVLVDEGSASASEIVAGALQDQDRAVIIGTPTYGKGLVQEQYVLSNGGALRLTIARYYTPSGRLIQKPYENGASVEDTGQNSSDTVVYHTSQGRDVSGSGGITPDILVESGWDWHDKRMYGLYENVLEYAIHGYWEEFDYTDVSDLLARFPQSNTVRDAIVRYFGQAKGADTRFDQSALDDYPEYARMLLMAMIASSEFGDQAWFEVMNAEDPVVQKGLEVIHEDRRITLRMDD